MVWCSDFVATRCWMSEGSETLITAGHHKNTSDARVTCFNGDYRTTMGEDYPVVNLLPSFGNDALTRLRKLLYTTARAQFDTYRNAQLHNIVYA